VHVAPIRTARSIPAMAKVLVLYLDRGQCSSQTA
jgi:hypothetical protein